MVNVINNSVLHTYNDGANTSAFFMITSDLDRRKYDELVSQIVSVNKKTPCNVWMSKNDMHIFISFNFKSPSTGLDSSKISLDFRVDFRNKEERDWCFSNFYNYIVQEVGYSVSDYFRSSNDMPFISEEKDSFYVRIKPNMLTQSFDDVLGNNTIIVEYTKDADYE